MRDRVGVTVVVVLGFCALGWLLVAQREHAPQPPDTSSRPMREVPAYLRGRSLPPDQPHQGTGDATATLPRRYLTVRGVVLANNGLSWGSAGAGVRVLSVAGRPRVSMAETSTRQDGTFELVEDVPEGASEAALSRGIVASAGDSACSYPVFVGGDTCCALSSWVVLRLVHAVRIDGRVLSPDGGAVSHAECIVRWLLPAGTQVRQENVGAVVPQYMAVTADEEGRYSFGVPPGIVEIAARAPASRAIGRPCRQVAEVPELRMPDLVVGTRGNDVSFAVRDPQEHPIHGAVLIAPRDLLLHVPQSPGSGREEGCLRASPDGMLTLSGVGTSLRPFQVVIAAPGYVPRIAEVGSQWTAAPVLAVLREKPRAEVHLRGPVGQGIQSLQVNWSAKPVGVASPPLGPDGGGEDRWLRERVEESFPDIERVTGADATDCTVFAAGPGPYRVTGSVAGGVRVSRNCLLGYPPAPVYELDLPPGRLISLELSEASVGDETCTWRLRVRGYSSLPHSERGLPDALLEVPNWRPTREDRAISVWCPMEVQFIEIGGANRIDLPVDPLLLPVPRQGDTRMLVDVSTEGCGWLHCEYESPQGVPRAGVELEFIPLGMPTNRPNGRSTCWTDAGGTATIALPRGEYYVSRSRRYGPASWSRHWVSAGTTTEVRILD